MKHEEGLRAKTARIRAGMKQVQLAKILGCTPQNISRIESGQSPLRYSTMARIASALSMKMESIWSNEEIENAFSMEYGKEMEEQIDNLEETLTTVRNAFDNMLLGYYDRLSAPNKRKLLVYAADLLDCQSLQEIAPDRCEGKQIQKFLS